MKKTILISRFAIPYNGIASWTTRFSHFVKTFDSIDYILCPEKNLDKELIKSKHCFVREPKYFRYKFDVFIKYYRFFDYWRQLKKLIKQEKDNVTVMIIDDLGLLKMVHYYAVKENVRNKINILFFLHGYHYFMPYEELNSFYAMIDDLILTTKSAYKFQVKHVPVISCEVTHIYNGVDSKLFRPILFEQKYQLKDQLALEKDKIYFLWLSQDRPKKGLHIILRAWEKLIEKYTHIELLIIGTHHEIKGKQIKWLGRIPNNELTPYYQVSDFYLFSTLWHEGFGLSLVEAIKCGAVCIASDIDPVKEVMGEGKYGRLVPFPNMPDNWVEVIMEELEKYKNNNNKNPYFKNIPENLYGLDIWSKNINFLINKWKNR